MTEHMILCGLHACETRFEVEHGQATGVSKSVGEQPAALVLLTSVTQANHSGAGLMRLAQMPASAFNDKLTTRRPPLQPLAAPYPASTTHLAHAACIPPLERKL